MHHFIEVHFQSSSDSRPCIINVDWIAYITPLDNGSLLHLATMRVDGQQGGRIDT